VFDPTEGVRGTRELSRLVSEYGFVGAHTYPHWFELPPDDARYYPYYAKCVELDVPIQSRSGTACGTRQSGLCAAWGAPSPSTPSRATSPEVKLTGIHTGWPWTEEMISVAHKHPNVYMGADAHAPKHWPQALVRYIDSWGSDKVLFGTDWPVIAHDRAIEEIASLGLRAASAEKLLGGYALRLYELG
jgi:uncharacterized protein